MAVKSLQHEDDHSTSPSVRVKNAWSCMSAPPYSFLALCLIRHGDKFSFTFSLYLTGTCCLHTIQMMALTSSYDTSHQFYQSLRCHTVKDSNIQSYRYQKLKSSSPPYPFKWALHVFGQFLRLLVKPGACLHTKLIHAYVVSKLGDSEMGQFILP